MKLQKRHFIPAITGFIALSVAFYGCSSESSTGTDDDDSIVRYSQGSDNPNITSANSGASTDPNQGNESSNDTEKQGSDNKNTGTDDSNKGNSDKTDTEKTNNSESNSVADWMPTSAASTETVSSEEVLAEAKNVVNGTCGPSVESVEKGSMATWTFNRTSGDVFEQIMAPFVWTFSDGKVIKGNGMQNVNISYETSGPYTATLNVDGNDITCSPLNVQGIPITVKSCAPDKSTANAGEPVTWTVEAESESPITGYKWLSDTLQITENGASASITGTPSMHKQKIAPTVQITNEDKTVQTFSCTNTTIVDPNSVDVDFVLDKEVTIPINEPFVAQIPVCKDGQGAATSCTMSCQPNSLNGDVAKATIEGITCSQNDAPYVACSMKPVSGQKVSILIETRATDVVCKVSLY